MRVSGATSPSGTLIETPLKPLFLGVKCVTHRTGRAHQVAVKLNKWFKDNEEKLSQDKKPQGDATLTPSEYVLSWINYFLPYQYPFYRFFSVTGGQ